MNLYFSKFQRGAATLVTAIALLILVTMAVMFSANVGIMETKTTANEYRALQAQLSAQAGIDFALANLSTFDLQEPANSSITNFSEIDANSVQITTTPVNFDATISTGTYEVTIDKTDLSTLEITSTGYSGDGSANSVLKQKLEFAPALPPDIENFMQAPVIASDNVEIKLSNINQGTLPAIVLAGGEVTGSGVNTYSATDNRPQIGQKIFSFEDTTTNNPHGKMFAVDKSNLKQMSRKKDCSTGCNSTVTTSVLSGDIGKAKVHYLEGGDVTISDTTLGHPDYPVIIYVDLTNGGSLTLGNSTSTNNTTINGILFVDEGAGNSWNNNNYQATINGYVVVNGKIVNGEGLHVNYNSTVHNNLKDKVGVYTRLPGSWSDIN